MDLSLTQTYLHLIDESGELCLVKNTVPVDVNALKELQEAFQELLVLGKLELESSKDELGEGKTHRL